VPDGQPPAPAPAPTLRPAGFLRQALRIAAKDLAIEWRSGEVLATMTFLAVVVVLIFSFAFVLEGSRTPAPVVAGIIWIALVVSGTVGLGRTFDRERDGEAIRSLLLTPAPRAAIYLGKLVATVALMAITETALTALSGLPSPRRIASAASTETAPWVAASTTPAESGDSTTNSPSRANFVASSSDDPVIDWMNSRDVADPLRRASPWSPNSWSDRRATAVASHSS